VAVYYDDDKAGHLFYIGQVLEIIEENKAVVTFLEQCTVKNRTGNVDRKFVFHANFLMDHHQWRNMDLGKSERTEEIVQAVCPHVLLSAETRV
jgi:hypothetical protein